jgi:hypothetical protein
MKSAKRMERKKKRWSRIEILVNHITDRLGLGIDSEIKESVTVLLVLGFITTGSCQGHLNRGNAAPWINIGKRIPKEILIKKKGLRGFLNEEDAEKTKAITKKNLRNQIRLMKLIYESYGKREVSYDVRLVLNRFGIYGDATLESTGERFQGIRSKEQKEKKLKQYQREMKEFTAFLQKKYFTI